MILINKNKEDNDNSNSSSEIEVILLSTCITMSPTTDKISMLHERVLQRYPQLQSHKKVMNNNSDPKIIIISEGIFSLRMGSVDAIIEKSPELYIIQDNNDDDCVLILDNNLG